MSIQSIGNATDFFKSLPNDLVGPICSFLDDRSIIRTAAVSSTWYNEPELQIEREQAFVRLVEKAYPEKLITLFRECNRPIGKLPELDLGDCRSCPDYIDFISPEDMPHSVMRFRDMYKRPGIALKICSNGQFPGGQFPTGADTNVLALFKRFIHGSEWGYAWGNSDDNVGFRANYVHAIQLRSLLHEACDSCPFRDTQVHPDFLRSLLENSSPYFKLTEFASSQ